MFPTSLCGVLVFDSVSRSSAAASSSLFHTQLRTYNCHTQLAHTQPHNFATHTQLAHTQLCRTPHCHTIFHTQLCHIQSSHTTLSQTTCSHTTTQLCHSHTTCSHTTLSHTTLSHHLSHTTLSHTIVTHNFVTNNLLTHNHTTLPSHTTCSHTALSHTTCSHMDMAFQRPSWQRERSWLQLDLSAWAAKLSKKNPDAPYIRNVGSGRCASGIWGFIQCYGCVKHSASRLFYLFSRLHFLSSDSFSSLIFSLLLFSSQALPTSAFPSVHIVGSLTSKLPSVNMFQNMRFLFLNVVCLVIANINIKILKFTRRARASRVTEVSREGNL